MLWAGVRLGAAIIALTAVVAGLVVNVDRALRFDQDLGLVLANYVSYFTILSTILSAAMLTIAAVWSLRHRDGSVEPMPVALGLGTATGAMILLGIVYNLLLRGLPGGAAGAPGVIQALDQYAIEAMHVVLPLYFLADAILAPRRRGLPWWSLAVLFGYPVAWVGYTMLRGELVPSPDGADPWWYPYPFLDPHGPGGYAGAYAYITAIAAASLVMSVIVIAIGRLRARREHRNRRRPREYAPQPPDCNP